ncbi:MAG: ferrous iron transport protein B [Cyanobacteria bacterium REEB65]|nr:ferrous iron transport protein B [Cyanobacteria bacterium REEB65]
MAVPVASRGKTLTIALAGNPNVGKSTLFNGLTGLHQHVGNWSGKTVERKEGRCQIGNQAIRLIDLPGTYSLSALSPEERIARDYIAQEGPDAVIAVVDAANLERNLYLTLQLLELSDRVVVALNMMDVAERHGLELDVAELERQLGVPVVPLVAERRKGLAAVVEAAVEVASSPPCQPLRVALPPELAPAVTAVQGLLPAVVAGYDRQWFARKLLEGDSGISELAAGQPEFHAAWAEARELRAAPTMADAEAEVIEAQYAAISEIVRAAVRDTGRRSNWSDRLDRIVTHRYWGFPILVAIFALMFWATFSLGAGTPLNDAFNALLDRGGSALRAGLDHLGAPSVAKSFLVDGLWAGFETVVGFFPLIAVFFTCFAVLEDSGYLARAAFLMDRFMAAIGLHGRSFLPLLMGFGCNVPAVMATRSLENRADRLLTILVNPLMLCQARLVVFVFFAGTFFAGWRASAVMLSLYALSALLMMAVSACFKRVLFPGEPAPFLLELPPYHRPILRNVVAHAWQSTQAFIRRAGVQITAMTGVVWLFTHLPRGPVDGTVAGMLGRTLSPIGNAMGLPWRLMVSLIGGFLAKEGALASLAVLYGVDQGGLAAAMHRAITPLSAYAFMVVSLVYIPCYSTIVTIWKETLSWRWTAFATTYGLGLAFLLGTGVYQIGHLLGLG